MTDNTFIQLRDEKQLLEPTQERLEREVAALVVEQQADIENLTLELEMAHMRIRELEQQKTLLVPLAQDQALTASFKPYLDRFDEVKGAAERGVLREHWNMKVNGAYVDTLYYSYKPSEVMLAASRLLKILGEISTGRGEGRREGLVITKGVLYGLARLFGYYNLYRYLSRVSPGQSDSRLLPMLCNLAVPTEQIIEQADRADTNIFASSWLEEHLPPLGSAPNPCCFMPTREAGLRKEDFLKYRSDYWMSQFRSPDWEPHHGKSYWISVGRDIAQEIIATEMSNLIDFRQSLYISVSSFGPVLPEEFDQQEQTFLASLAQPQVWALPLSGPRVRIVEHGHGEGGHMYLIELDDLANGLNKPVLRELVVDSEGDDLEEEL